MASGDADDEEVIQEAIDLMFSLCGNPGQETLIDRGTDAFTEYCLAFLEEEGADADEESFRAAIEPEIGGATGGEWEATSLIWYEGMNQAYSMGWGRHDTFDEAGEGEGI